MWVSPRLPADAPERTVCAVTVDDGRQSRRSPDGDKLAAAGLELMGIVVSRPKRLAYEIADNGPLMPEDVMALNSNFKVVGTGVFT